MIAIREATAADIPLIQDIAHKTWPETYGPILPEGQVAYMLGLFYTSQALQKNFASGQHFLIAEENGGHLAFASYEMHYQNSSTTRIPKIYVLPESQGKGLGRMLIERILQIAQETGNEKLQLNVNRHNKALHFYEYLGFEIVAQVDIPIGKGFLMEDFIMEKRLPRP